MSGKLLVIGFGPGSFDHITHRAKEALQESDMIIGYKTYVELIEGLLTDQEIISTGMTEEVTRAQEAVKQAEQGKKVAVISSGDAGVYGMAGLVYEVLVEKGWDRKTGVEVEVIPGVSAINSCGSILGAPIMHDACTISLSDHLTPWSLIEKRIDAAAQADFVIALYNPKSGRRTRQIAEAQRILLSYRSPDTPVGLVKSAYREREQVVITNLKEMLDHDIGMLTTVIIGNSSTFLYDDLMITPRGYQRKYTLGQTEQPLKPHQRLKKENEPWALEQEEEFPKATEAAAPIKKEEKITSRAIAEQALLSLGHTQTKNETKTTYVKQEVESIFELGVSPGIASKRFTPRQLMVMAEVVGEKGRIDYTRDHQINLQVYTSNPNEITERLRAEGLILLPLGDVLTVKACDFCDCEKKESIPYAEELHERLGGMELPKELKIGFNGCGMACYGAVHEDIGLVFRKGKFDLFLGGKTVGRTAHPGQPVAEGIESEEIVPLIERIVEEYKEKGHPNERLFKFFKRVKNIQGYTYQDMTPKIELEPAPCGD
ncbi:precorrin-3B C(17)-methyltransferase [Metabacillus fastidiosus]|uniref:precorrin-3B C(17)-methyltransferase n=1 Tax=Metabacillus fastidiosus TaxID=1458 RepID=UPI003D283FB2